MTGGAAREPAWPSGSGPGEAPLLRLDGYEGPLDLLLELARLQKVDLHRISILQLVEQYLAAVEGVRPELAADWLVMAAWLAWLKSRLLLPDPVAPEEGEEAAGLLQARLAELAEIREASAWLQARPVLGRDVWARGAPEALRAIDRSGLSLDLGQLLGAYLACSRRQARRSVYRPRRERVLTVIEASERLRRLLGGGEWQGLERFLPGLPDPAGAPGRARRAALAAMLLAGLELARDGTLELQQEQPFGPVLFRRGRHASALKEAAE